MFLWHLDDILKSIHDVLLGYFSISGITGIFKVGIFSIGRKNKFL
jgi:hypothetical protein